MARAARLSGADLEEDEFEEIEELLHEKQTHPNDMVRAIPVSRGQAFRFMVGPGHCPMISIYGPSLSKAAGPVNPSFLVVKKSHSNKKYSSNSDLNNKW